MSLRVMVAISSLLFASQAMAGVEPFPPQVRARDIATNGTTIHVRVGGDGPAVLLLHGFADTGDMWAPLATRLVKDHTVIAPDLRGMGLSGHPEDGYEKKNQAADLVGVLDKLRIQKVDLVTHDIGNMVGYAFAALHPDRVRRWVVIDAPLPGVGNWDAIVRSPLLWHFNFRGPDMERLVAGRERIYLDRFWNELSADPKGIDEATRRHYAALYARPRAMHDAFSQFAAFSQDAIDNKELVSRGKLTMPVLAVGGEKSFGTAMADEVRFVAEHVRAGVVSRSGHWVMEENPRETVALVMGFLDDTHGQVRLTPDEIQAKGMVDSGAGTSGVSGIRTTVLSGDPAQAGLYTIRLTVPPRTKIAAHTHRDDRTAVVISGTWYFGYGREASDGAKRALPAGSFYSEPAGVAHFAETKEELAVVEITGYGPTDTEYTEEGNDPRPRGASRAVRR